MDHETETLILHRAVEEGLISSDALASTLSVDTDAVTLAGGPRWSPRIDELVSRGVLKAEDVARLEMFFSETSADLTIRTGDSPVVRTSFLQAKTEIIGKPDDSFPGDARPRMGSDTEDWFATNPEGKADSTQAPRMMPCPPPRQAFPVKNWDRYEFVRLLGQGGMGIVYEAVDVRLKRKTALKFLRVAGGLMAERFMREARSQSRVEHEGVCKVHEVGEVEGMPYIAMQYVEGKPLTAAAADMTLEQQVRVMRDAALALHEAHRIGLIHRDIKPDNVLVEWTEFGQPRPVVMDFGLAREAGAEGMTESGMLMGTPAYMSPEQARGEVRGLDRRTDVYGLGAMMYELFVGRPPFVGSSPMNIVLKVLDEEVRPVRERVPTIPRDLDAITMKCLEKSPDRRYDSAQALAEDLQKFLDGEPISAAQTTWTRVLLKKARKHKGFVVAGSVVFMLALVFGGFSAWTWWRSAKQAELARRLGEQAERVEAMMRFARLTPIHDIRADRALVLEEIETIRAQTAAAGRLGEGPGNYTLGRAYLALDEFDAARDHLERAERAGFSAPELDLALGKVRGELYRAKLGKIRRISDKSVREAESKKIEAEYLEPARRHLAAYLNSGTRRSVQEAALAEGLAAFYRNDFDAALNKAWEAAGRASWFYEARLLEGEIHLAHADELENSGDDAAALDALVKAEAAFDAAVRIGQSDIRAYLGKAGRWTALLNIHLNRNKPLRAEFDHATEACRRALQIDPESSRALRLMALAYQCLGQGEFEQGQDPRPTLEQAIPWAEKALAKDPGNTSARETVGMVHFSIGRYVGDRGGDPRPWLERSAQAHQKNLEYDPRSVSSYTSLGVVYLILERYETGHGIDPRPSMERAADAYRKALEINPKYFIAWNNLSLVYVDRGQFEMVKGIDPRPSLNLAEGAIQKALEMSPKNSNTRGALGSIRYLLYRYEMLSERDPQPWFDLAEADFRVAGELNPQNVTPPYNLALINSNQALYLFDLGKDPTEHLERSRAALKKTDGINPNFVLTPIARIDTELTAARWAMKQGNSPEPFFAAVESAVKKGLELNSDNASVYMLAAKLGLYRTRWAVGQNKNPKPILDRALASVEKSLAVNPGDGRTIALKGDLLLEKAKSTKDAQTARAAVAVLETALRDNPTLKSEYGGTLTEAKQLANSK